MATRLYFGNGVPTISPTFDASWEATGSAVRRMLEDGKAIGAAYETLSAATTLNSPAGAVDVLIAQYTSPPLNGNQTISGNIKGQIKAVESSTAADLRAQIVVWVRKADGTSRGTLYAGDSGALSNEFPITTATNRQFPRGGSTAVTSVAALDTDRIVVEVGYRKHENATTSRTGSLVLGTVAGDSDLGENETDTSATLSAWIEFADTLAFQVTPSRASMESVEAAILPTSQAGRASMEAVEAVVLPTSQTGRVSMIAVEFVAPSNLPAAVSGRFHAQIIG